MITYAIISIIALIITLSICIKLEHHYRCRKLNREWNATALLHQPDELYNPQALYPLDELIASSRDVVGSNDPLFKLGSLFQSLGYHQRYGISFEQYIRKVEHGTWQDLTST